MSSRWSFDSGTESAIARRRSTPSTGAARAIAGAPLTDGYHFAQTLTNDYGRPYGSGANIYTGISGRAAYGSFASYVRVELQRTAPGVVTPASADAAIAAADFTPSAAVGADLRFQPRTRTRSLRLVHLSQQPTLLWKASVVVGAGQRRPAPLQQQCRAHHHAPLRSGLPVRAAWVWPAARPDSCSAFPGSPFRTSVRACWGSDPGAAGSCAQQPAVYQWSEVFVQANTQP